MDRALLAQESRVSLYFWKRNGHANHDKWLSSASNLTPATKRKQARICTDKRHLVPFDVQHHNSGHFNLFSCSESLLVLWGLRKGKDCHTGTAINTLTWHQRFQRADLHPNNMRNVCLPRPDNDKSPSSAPRGAMSRFGNHLEWPEACSNLYLPQEAPKWGWSGLEASEPAQEGMDVGSVVPAEPMAGALSRRLFPSAL